MGPECSLLAFVDGTTVVPMAPAQDHKRAFDDDTDPTPAAWACTRRCLCVSAEEYARMVEILEQTATALAEEDIEFRGVLYGGFILTAEGPRSSSTTCGSAIRRPR